MRGQQYVLQVAPEDCTGCNLCVEVCPAKDRTEPSRKAINMESRLDHLEAQKANYDFFLDLPERTAEQLERIDIRTSQLISPLFEYSGACSGCGETPYIKLLTQLYGDRLLIANATGCSSIYGGNLPSTPTPPMRTGAGRPGPTPCSRTTPNLAWASGSPWINIASGYAACWRAWGRRPGRAATGAARHQPAGLRAARPYRATARPAAGAHRRRGPGTGP